MLVVNQNLSIPLREFSFTFVRSQGPGGQNVNKVNTKATLRWNIEQSQSLTEAVKQRFRDRFKRRVTSDGDVLVTSQRFRDQGRNVADCLSKLREMLEEVAHSPKRRKKTKPTRASRERRLKDKKAKSAKKQQRRSPALD